jgi:hypothetical protein
MVSFWNIERWIRSRETAILNVTHTLEGFMDKRKNMTLKVTNEQEKSSTEVPLTLFNSLKREDDLFD